LIGDARLVRDPKATTGEFSGEVEKVQKPRCPSRTAAADLSRPLAEDARPPHVSRQALERDGGSGPLL